MSAYWWLKEHCNESLLRIAVFQGSSSSDGNVSLCITEVERQAQRASREHSAHLLVFPELFLSGYGHSRNVTLDAARYINQKHVIAHLQNTASQYSIALLVCYPELVNNEIYNSATLINENGNILLTYRKTHLWADKERETFVEGDRLSPVIEIRNVRIAVMICYDLEFPEVARCLAVQGAQLILIPTALAGSPTSENIARHFVSSRAMENHVWIAYANLAPPEFMGLSCIIGPDGNELCHVENDSLIVADLIPKNYLHIIQSTPYLADRRAILYTAISDPNYLIKLPVDYKYIDN